MEGAFIFCSIYGQQNGVSTRLTWDLGSGLETLPAVLSLSKTQNPYQGYSYVLVLDVADFNFMEVLNIRY